MSPACWGFKSHPLHFGVNPLLFDYLLGNIREVTAKSYMMRLSVLSKLGDLDNPERIRDLICKYPVSEARKELLSNAYDYYVKFNKLTWSKPHFTREDKPIFIALESELDQLISKAHLKLSVFLELLKETAADSGEAWKLRWIDIDVDHKAVSITPTKNHNARTLPISNHLLARLLQLPRKADRVFLCRDIEDWSRVFYAMRKELTVKLGNPRLMQISFRTFRHWKATMEYQRTKDILHVKWFLGHKRIENTLVYTHLIPFAKDEYVCKVAHNLQETSDLIESGFDYVTEMDGVKLFRKRK